MDRQIIEISNNGFFLSLYRGFLVIENEKKQKQEIPLDNILSLILSADNTVISKNIVNAVIEQGGNIIFCDKKYLPSTIAVPYTGHWLTSHRIKQQIDCSRPLQKNLWKSIVQHKILNQASVLEYFFPDNKNIERLKILAKDTLSDDARNHEGMAAALYFKSLFGKKFVRNRLNPDINILLNYAYTILRAMVARAVSGNGLLPYLGLKHCGKTNSLPLVDDLIEPFRAIADKLVFDEVNKIINTDNIELNAEIKRNLAKLTALVVDTVDRLQRTFNEFPMLLELVKKEKLALHFFKEGLVIDKNFKSSDLAMWQMQILSANMFVNSTRDNVKRSEERMLNEGLLPGPAPIGYLNTKDANGKKTIIIDPDRGHWIRKLFEEYSTGLFSMDELVKKSKNWGLRNRKSGNPITKAQFADILQNPFYYGVMYYNKSYFPHIYEKLISKELFDKCTEVRTGKFKRTSKHTREPYIFRGLVRCKHCGCLLSPYTKKGQYVYLRHTDLKNCEHCNNISEKILLKEVEKALASICFDDELKIALADALKKRYEATHGNNHYQLEKNRNQLVDVEENQKKLLDLLIAGTVSAEVYRSKNAEYETAKIELQAKIEQLQTPDNSVERAIDKVLNFSQNSFAIFKSSQIEEKRRILNIVFANFLMDGKNPEISMHKNFKLLSKIGACEDWCPGEDSNFHYLR